METMNVYAWIFPVVLLAIAAAVVIGARSSGGERRTSDVERRLGERTFTGAQQVRLEWPKDRRRPTLAGLERIGESYGYRLVGRSEQEHVWALDFELVPQDEDL